MEKAIATTRNEVIEFSGSEWAPEDWHVLDCEESELASAMRAKNIAWRAPTFEEWQELL